MALVPLVAAICLAACTSSEPPEPLSPYQLAPAPGGLDVVGSGGREIGFGRAQLGVLQSIARIEGVAPRQVPCGPGQEAYATDSGLRLVFEDQRFVGWGSMSDRAGRTCLA